MASKGKVFKQVIVIGAVVILVGVLGYTFLFNKDKNSIPQGFVKGNGRLEATEVDIATKLSGRLAEVLVKEGDFVNKDQVVAKMDTTTLQAQLRQAEAEVARVKQVRLTTLSKVEGVRLKLSLANKELARSKNLNAQGIVPQQQYDRDLTAKQALEAEYEVVKSSVSEADAAIDAAIAQAERLKAEINDCMMKSPIKGPVLSRLAEPGEVLPNGGKVLTIVDPTDVYMNVYLSEQVSGEIPLGGEAKVVLDAIPDKSFLSRVAYVSAKAQFTPKEVEAAEERQKLVFRVTISFQDYNDPRLKPGMPGVAYIRSNPSAKWPEILK
jgi:HlyD family secretion protein